MPVIFNRIVNLSAGERGPNPYEKQQHDLEIAKVCWSIADMGAAKRAKMKKTMKKKNAPAAPSEDAGVE